MLEKLSFNPLEFSLVRVHYSTRYYADYLFVNNNDATSHLVCAVDTRPITKSHYSLDIKHEETIKFTLPRCFPHILSYKQDAPSGIILAGKGLYFRPRNQEGIVIGETSSRYTARYFYPIEMMEEKILEYEQNRWLK